MIISLSHAHLKAQNFNGHNVVVRATVIINNNYFDYPAAGVAWPKAADEKLQEISPACTLSS
jgi:hypothetical protein